MPEPDSPDNSKRHNEREVTDPVTHLPLLIHDAASFELERIPPPPSRADTKLIQQPHISDEQAGSEHRHATMEDVINEEMHEGWWSDPTGAENKEKIQFSIIAAASAGVGGIGGLTLSAMVGRMFRTSGWLEFFVELVVGILGCIGLALGAACAPFIWNNGHQSQKPQVQRGEYNKFAHNRDHQDSPESAAWLNSLLSSLWPIVNPALFTSVADMLEDAMQASLPKLIYGVRVADIGQGSEPLRVLGIRWLDAGQAAVEKDGMKAEEGDFVNMEVAAAYRAKSSTNTGLKGRSSNVHLLMEFWVTGGLVLPVWVEITGILATARLRIQLTPNPPFLSLLTLTLLGQPKVTMICTPLAKNFLNIMDIPGLSGWLQRSIDAAVAAYVAPGSLNLDLKTILTGRDKMDTDAVGVMIVTVRSAEGFKDGDGEKFWASKRAQRGDVYVTVGWSKWGKPLWSTRIIQDGERPVWEETTAILVGPTELNAQEELRLQVWDSDRMSADDILGTVDASLKDIMGGDAINRITVREDRLSGTDGSPWSGTLLWECGYFSKTTLKQHLAKKHQNATEIEQRIEKEAEDKLREARTGEQDQTGEVERQKKEDLKEKSDEIISGTKPTSEWPSGVLSIRIEQISGLEVRKIRQSGVEEDGEDDDADDLPSAYCTVIINHQRVYKTRTKMKSNKPFFDASTEKFIRDWHTTTVIIAVRDSRLHEIDPLLGVVVLPLHTLLSHRSQFNDSLPIVGGIGYGRMRLALIFRSIQAQLPSRLLGWDVGTLDIKPEAHASLDLPADLSSCRLVFHTLYGKGKMASHQDGGWRQKRDRPIRLAVKKRYASCLVVHFKKHAFGPDLTPAFCTLWLKDIPDNEDVHLELPVIKNTDGALACARANVTYGAGERVGTLDLNLRFWPGLSGYHQNTADHDMNMADVMEVLDCAEESKEISQDLLYDENASDDNSSSSSSENADEGKEGQLMDGRKQGVRNDFMNFRKKKGELHRKHRGLMQWRAARNLAWIGRGVEHKAERLGEKVMGTFKHRDRDIEIDTEV